MSAFLEPVHQWISSPMPWLAVICFTSISSGKTAQFFLLQSAGVPPEVLDGQTRTFETNSAIERENQLSILTALEIKYGR